MLIRELISEQEIKTGQGKGKYKGFTWNRLDNGKIKITFPNGKTRTANNEKAARRISDNWLSKKGKDQNRKPKNENRFKNFVKRKPGLTSGLIYAILASAEMIPKFKDLQTEYEENGCTQELRDAIGEWGNEVGYWAANILAALLAGKAVRILPFLRVIPGWGWIAFVTSLAAPFVLDKIANELSDNNAESLLGGWLGNILQQYASAFFCDEEVSEDVTESVSSELESIGSKIAKEVIRNPKIPRSQRQKIKKAIES